MPDGKDDKPKRSWREIDAAKDRSLHRRDDRPKGGARAQERSGAAQKQYRAALDKLFDKGREAIGEGWKKVLPDMPSGDGLDPGAPRATTRQDALRAVRSAGDRRQLEAAVDTLLTQFSLPDDPDLLVAVLQDSRDSVLRDALTRLDSLMPLRAPGARNVLQTRLRRIEDDEDLDTEVRRMAASLRKKS